MTTLYTLQKDKFRVWTCTAEGAEVVVVHGLEDGKLVEKRYEAEAKNVGRANATTPEQQALLEVEAKIDKQLKTGYFRTKEQASNYVPFTPMKAQDYRKQAKKIKYPVLMQPKLNGQRMMIDKNGDAWSKQGEKLELPKHWKGVKELAILVGGLDGEVYAGLESDGGLSLQDIISAFRKENENTHMLKYWVYDIPDGTLTMDQRDSVLKQVSKHVTQNNIKSVVVVFEFLAESERDGDIFYDGCVRLKYEGVVYRNVDGMYEFGKRSHDLIKRKPRQEAEAKILSYTLDKNDEPVYTAQAVNGEQEGSVFKLKMKIPDGVIVEGRNYRNKANADNLVGQHVNYEFEELSDEKIPTKPVGIAVREVINGQGRW